MDFFTAQDQARRRSGWLVFFFLMAVISLVGLTNLLVLVAFGLLNLQSTGSGLSYDWRAFSLVSAVVVMVVLCGTLYKIAKLSRGGDAVAAMFGGKPVFGDDEDPGNRRLVHVVEEMSIASGVPVPQVYILNESGINAFAAGFSASDAVIAVTKGAVGKLNREQLQGVVAHEFSHILNGDMRLNVRLVGVLHGILLIGLIGDRILRGSDGSSRRSGGRGLLLGLGLVVIGYAGTFFGNLIKAAVSRQREFLADAAAVQFTRNPDGIGGALLQIGANRQSSLLFHPKSQELSHAFFSQGVNVIFASLFATHPPLTERIRRILPGWDGAFPKDEDVGAPIAFASSTTAAAGAAASLSGAAVFDGIGRPDSGHLLRARHLLGSVDEAFRKAARDPFAARALLLYLVLDGQGEVRERQLQHLKAVAARGVYPEVQRLVRAGTAVRRDQRLALVELALPALRRISPEESRLFLENLDAIIRADGRINLFEWSLYRIVAQSIEDYLCRPAKAEGSLIARLEQVNGECAGVLTMMVRGMPGDGPHRRSEAFRAGAAAMGLPTMKPVSTEELNLVRLDRSLKVLRRLEPQAKARLVKGLVACVEADGRIEPAEAELLRGVAAALAVPMPLAG